MWPISRNPNDQQGSPGYHFILTFTWSYHCNVNWVEPLDQEKQAEAGFLYVFDVGFSTSLFATNWYLYIHRIQAAGHWSGVGANPILDPTVTNSQWIPINY